MGIFAKWNGLPLLKSQNDEKSSYLTLKMIKNIHFFLVHNVINLTIKRHKEKKMSILKKLFSGNSSKKEIEEETAETKKCVRCLRRIKITFNTCPHCRSADFIYES
jgi:hypothetical protein